MDNVTHSLAGLLLAEGATQLRRRATGAEPTPRFRTVAAATSLVAANLPDFDLLYTGLGGDRLAYMLQHRGYTHTFVLALVGAVLVWGIAMVIWRWRGGTVPHDDARWLLALLVVSTTSHILLDWTNSYGVHPFWPVDDRWRYGDAVFIVEPWFWVVSVPALVAATRSRVARGLLGLVLVVGLALAWRVSAVSRGAATVLTIGAVLSIALAATLSPGARAVGAVGGWIAVTLVMAVGSASARASTVRAVRASDPAAELLDVVVTPMPANAVCMSVITVERSGAAYRVATARASALPSLTTGARCGRDRVDGTMRASPRASTLAVQWESEWSAPAAELAGLARESCPALAALRFIRVPIWVSSTAADSLVSLGDVRYGGAAGGFASLTVATRDSTCPRAVPPWVPPRSDVIR